MRGYGRVYFEKQGQVELLTQQLASLRAANEAQIHEIEARLAAARIGQEGYAETRTCRTLEIATERAGAALDDGGSIFRGLGSARHSPLK